MMQKIETHKEDKEELTEGRRKSNGSDRRSRREREER